MQSPTLLLSGKIALITGGARGIGKTIARVLGESGATVIICDINQEKGRKTTEDLKSVGITTEFIHCDLAKKSEAQKLVVKTIKKFGHLDILVNNARSGKRLALIEETEMSWDDTFSVTLKAAFFASQTAIQYMRKSGGSIVNISSVEARLAGFDSPSYQIAKAGLEQMTRYFAVQGGKYNIRVNAVTPGFIVQDEHLKKYAEKNNTRYQKIAAYCHPGGNIGSSTDIANAVLFLCSPLSKFITGQCLTVDGGLTIQEQSQLIYGFDKSSL